MSNCFVVMAVMFADVDVFLEMFPFRERHCATNDLLGGFGREMH